MNNPTTQVSVRCEDCGATFAVEGNKRTHECESCGGTARISNPSHEPPPEGSVTCTECDAINPGGTAYCAECGATLEPSKPHPGSQAALRLRQESAHVLKGGYRGINAVALMYRFGAAAYIVATFLAVLALARNDVPEEGGLLVVALTTSMSVLLLMAALHIQFEPYLWTIAVGVLATIVSVVHLIGPNPMGIAFIGSAGWAVLAWAALLPTLRFRKIIAHHKDLYILHHASTRTRRSLKGHTAHERHERLVRAMRKASRRAWRVSAAAAAGIVLASALGSFAILQKARPQALEPIRAGFESAWNQGDFDRAATFLHERVRTAEELRLNGRIDGHGWRDNPPQLVNGVPHEEEDGLWIDYDANGVALSANWVRSGPAWSVQHINIPFPPLAPTFERFKQAWSDSSAEGLASFFAEDAQKEMLARIEKSIRERNWDSLPPFDDFRLQDSSSGQANGLLSFGKEALQTEWHFRNDGTWRLHGLVFPKRYKKKPATALPAPR